MLQIILIILLILLLLGGIPAYSYRADWGYYPLGGLGIVVVILILLLLFR